MTCTHLDTQIAYWTLRVRVDRMRRLVRIMLEQRRMKMPWLQAAAKELERLKGEVEDDARKFVEEDVGAALSHKSAVFGNARKRVKDIRGDMEEFGTFLDDLDKATNGGPTSGDSSQSPVSANPAETAHLPEAK